jgi:hypothetical protein
MVSFKVERFAQGDEEGNCSSDVLGEVALGVVSGKVKLG